MLSAIIQLTVVTPAALDEARSGFTALMESDLCSSPANEAAFPCTEDLPVVTSLTSAKCPRAALSTGTVADADGTGCSSVVDSV